MTLLLNKVADEQKRKPTGQEKDQFLKQAGDFQRRFMDGSLVPNRALETWQQVSEGWVLGESGVPEPKPAELFLDKPIQHPHLSFVSEFEVEVPADFALDSVPRTAYCPNGWNANITDINFPRMSLVKGKRYMAEIYQLRCNKSSESIVKIADERKRVLPGALGGAVLTSRYGEKLPKDFWVVCLDKIKNLWRDGHGLHVPIFNWNDFGWDFNLDIWNGDWFQGFYIVFFREFVSNP
ncbi:MAG: hypothetical protein NUV53_05230 [Patescibacteria group bacterium]|nr:hypothetical protein [Patescibacteria group bacterium]